MHRIGTGRMPKVVPPSRSSRRGHLVLLLASGNSKFVGGVPGQVLSRAKYLSDFGFEVTIIARGNVEWHGVQLVDGIRVFALRPRDFKLGKWIAKQWFHPLLGTAIAHFLPKLDATIPIDCLLVFDSQTGIPALSFGARRSIPVIFLVNGTALDPVPMPKFLRRSSLKWEKTCYTFATLVAPVSNAILKTYRMAFGQREGVQVLPNAFSPVFTPLDTNDTELKNFMFVGRFENDKRPLNALQAILQTPGVNLRVLGDGSLRPELERVASESSSIWISDAVVNDRIVLRDHYRWGHCFLWVSAAESFGVAPLEAMACGQIVIAPNIPAAKEILGEDYELFVEVDDLPALRAAINRVRTDASLVKRCRVKCQEAVSRFSEKEAYGQLLVAIDQEIKQSSRYPA